MGSCIPSSLSIVCAFLPRKWLNSSNVHLKVFFYNEELAAIINFGDAHDVAVLLPPLDIPLAFTGNNYTSQMALVILGLFLPNFGIRVEELGFARADCADACGGNFHPIVK